MYQPVFHSLPKCGGISKKSHLTAFHKKRGLIEPSFFIFVGLNHTDMENQHEEQNQLNIELNEEIAEGQYANLAIITHSNAEFVVDFVNVMPGLPKAKVKSRIILTPQHAKRFMKALQDNIKKYESVHGTIQDQEPVSVPMNFGGPTAQA